MDQGALQLHFIPIPLRQYPSQQPKSHHPLILQLLSQVISPQSHPHRQHFLNFKEIRRLFFSFRQQIPLQATQKTQIPGHFGQFSTRSRCLVLAKTRKFRAKTRFWGGLIPIVFWQIF